MQEKNTEERKRVEKIIWNEMGEMFLNPDIQIMKKIKFIYSIVMK